MQRNVVDVANKRRPKKIIVSLKKWEVRRKILGLSDEDFL